MNELKFLYHNLSRPNVWSNRKSISLYEIDKNTTLDFVQFEMSNLINYKNQKYFYNNNFTISQHNRNG